MRILLIFIFAFSISQAQALDWSFEDHPHPTIEQLSEAETGAITKAIDDQSERECALAQHLQYEIYLNRYPEFANVGTPESRKRAWMKHVLSPGRDIRRTCILFAEVSKLMELAKAMPKNDFFFCGKFSRAAKTPDEKEAFKLVTDIFSYTQLNEPEYADNFLSYNFTGHLFELHPDFEYYYRARFVPPSYIDDKKSVTPSSIHPNYTISPARKAELDTAIAKGDVQMVIDTMGDCFRS